MKKKVKMMLVVSAVVLAMTACTKEKPSCQKVMYQMDGIDVVTYQWMTEDEVEATFNKYDNVQIYHTDDAQTDCLTQNFD